MAEFEPYSVAIEKSDRAEERALIEAEVCQKLINWLLSKPRPPARKTFNLWPQRVLALHIEDAIRHAMKDSYAAGRGTGHEESRNRPGCGDMGG